MSQTIRFEELNDAAKEYLIRVRDTGGSRMPGIFVPSSTSLPTWGLFAGLAIVLTTVLVTLFSDVILGSPRSVACLQAAGIVTGGWMVVAAFRSWSARTSPDYAGHWYYADGSNFYCANGESIAITSLDRIREAKGTQNINNGVYTNTAVAISIEGDSQSFIVKDERGARDLVIFLNALAYLINDADESVRDFAPHIHGGLARECAVRGDFPTDFREEDVAVSEIPTMRPDNTASLGLMPIFLTAIAALVVWVLFSQINIGVRDDAIYDIVKSNPKPQNLRAYLLDDRNQSHRAEVEGWMKARYAQVAQGIAGSVSGAGEAPKDKELSEKMIAILDLIAVKSPVVSMRIRQKVDPAIRTFDHPALLDNLWSALSQDLTVRVGPEYMSLVKLTEEFQAIPAMIDIEYAVSQDGAAANMYMVLWTVTLRTGPEDAGVTRAWKQQAPIANFYNAVYAGDPPRIRARILGGYRNFDQPAPPPPADF